MHSGIGINEWNIFPEGNISIPGSEIQMSSERVLDS